MSELAKLQIDLTNSAKKIGKLLSNAGNINNVELFNEAYRAHMITSKIAIEVDRLIVPSFVAMTITGDDTQNMNQLTDRHWLPGL